MYVILIISIVIFDIYRKPKISYDFIRIFNIFFVIMYPLQGALFAFDNIFWMYERNYTFEYSSNPLMVYSMISLTYLFVILGYFCSNKLFENRLSLNIKKKNINVAKWSITFISIFFLLVISYSNLYGGFLNAVEKSELLRSGNTVRDPFAFLKRFFWFSNLAILLTGTALIFNQCNKKIYILFFISIFCTLISAVLTSGRGAIVGPFILLGLIYCNRIKQVLPIRLVIIVFCSILIVFIGDQLWTYLRKTIQGINYDFEFSNFQVFILNALSSLLSNFQYAYVSIEAYYSEYSLLRDGLRFGIDFPLGFISLLPSKIIGITIPPTISTFNTYNVKSEFMAFTPPGLTAFSLYSLSYLGIIIFPFLYGMIGNIITILARSGWKVWWVKGGYAVIAFSWAIYHGNSDPRVVLNQTLYIVFFILILFAFGYINISFVRNNKYLN